MQKISMDKLVITGGCGFIGVNLINYLLKENSGLRIVVIDNESLGKRKYLDAFDVKFIHGDIQDKELVLSALEGADAIVHLAADTRVLDSIADPVKNFQVNVVGTFNVLNAVRKHKISLFVNASTGGAILGDVAPPVHENMIPEPISPYGASKLAVEGYCSAYCGSYDIRASSLRFSNVYGPRSFHKGSVVAAFFKNILSKQELNVYGDGTQTRDFVFVEDVCNGIFNALCMGTRGVFQLGTGLPTSVNKLIELMREVVGGDAEIKVKYNKFRTGEVHATYCDISKAREHLRYNPSTTLGKGLEETWKWFKEHYSSWAKS